MKASNFRALVQNAHVGRVGRVGEVEEEKEKEVIIVHAESARSDALGNHDKSAFYIFDVRQVSGKLCALKVLVYNCNGNLTETGLYALKFTRV